MSDFEKLNSQEDASIKGIGSGWAADDEWDKAREDEKYPEKDSCSFSMVAVDPGAIGSVFVAYCVNRGWLVKRTVGAEVEYLATDEGKKELAKFGIVI